MDYRKLLGKKEEAVLAYFGGSHVHGKDRRLRVDAPRPSNGWHRFAISGREARVVATDVEPPALDDLPRARGHHVRGWLVSSGLERVRLLPAEEPAPFAIVRARRWYSSDLVFESLDFDGETEEAARLLLEGRASLGDLRGVAASLRVAYGIALALAVADRSGIALSVREAASAGPALSAGGEAAAQAFVVQLDARRTAEAERSRIHAIVHGGAPHPPVVARRVTPRDAPTLDNAAVRAEIALDGADARMLSSRRLGQGSLEVAFEFMGQRFVSVVEAISLNVHDAGVCLDGADTLVTLDSLPGVIREAIQTGSLVITRH